MGIYCNHIFPRIMNFSMSGERPAEYRKRALYNARGRVLEEIVRKSGLHIINPDKFYSEKIPNAGGYTCLGSAEKA